MDFAKILYAYSMNLLSDPEAVKDLKREDLSYSTDSRPGFFRQKSGKGFNYYNTDGNRILDVTVINRIKELAIPPAWEDVWICPNGSGHLQATGFDDRGRKQYIYHTLWIKICNENKFSKLADFGLSLPKIRGKVDYELHQKDLDRERILATVIWLLEHTFIRVGNEEYSRENNSFGLTTLRGRHAKVRGDEITFKFRGKSGVENIIEVSNPTVAKTIKECIELPGYEIFKFVDNEGNTHVVDSSDVNEFLKDITKDDFSAKDFRTWGATNLSAKRLYRLGTADDKKIAKKNVTETVKTVARFLNNTAPVCRAYYIHPAVINSYSRNRLVPYFDRYAQRKAKANGLTWNEYALIKLIQNNP